MSGASTQWPRSHCSAPTRTRHNHGLRVSAHDAPLIQGRPAAPYLSRTGPGSFHNNLTSIGAPIPDFAGTISVLRDVASLRSAAMSTASCKLVSLTLSKWDPANRPIVTLPRFQHHSKSQSVLDLVSRDDGDSDDGADHSQNIASIGDQFKMDRFGFSQESANFRE